MPMMKRPAAGAAAAQPKAKQQKAEDPLTQKCSAIISVLNEAEGQSEATLQMLAGSVKSCLTSPKEDRHEVQNAVIEMIADVLSGVEASHAAKVDTMKAKIADADAEKQRREAAAVVTAEAERAQSEAVTAAEAQAEEAKAANNAAWGEVSEALEQQAAGDKDLDAAGGRKETAEAVMSSALRTLKDGSVEDAEKAVGDLTSVAQDLKLEEQLIATATVVFRKPVAERAAFDGVVIQQIDEQMRVAVASLTELLSNGEAGKAERAAKVEASQDKAKASQQHLNASVESIAVAKAALKEAKVATKAAETSVKDLRPEMEEASVAQAAAEAALVACKADLAVFHELVEGTPAAPEPALAAEGDETGEPEIAVEQEAGEPEAAAQQE